MKSSLKTTLLAFSLMACPLPVMGDVIFNDSFAGVADGPISGAPSWEGQANWTIASGKATTPEGFQRARRFAAFRVEDTELVKITLSDVTVSGTNNNNQFAFGFAKTNEHTGAQTPQVRAELKFNGSGLSIGGATDAGYDANDVVDLELTFTRMASAWSVAAVINNTTDGSSSSGSDASPTNLAGNVSPETVAQWLDADLANQLYFGMRSTSNTNPATLTVGGVKVEVVPEPASLALVAAGGLMMLRRRRQA